MYKYQEICEYKYESRYASKYKSKYIYMNVNTNMNMNTNINTNMKKYENKYENKHKYQSGGLNDILEHWRSFHEIEHQNHGCDNDRSIMPIKFPPPPNDNLMQKLMQRHTMDRKRATSSRRDRPRH